MTDREQADYTLRSPAAAISDGRVEQGDLDLVLLHWGNEEMTAPSGMDEVFLGKR